MNGLLNERKAGPAMVLRSKNVHKHYDTMVARHWHELAMGQGGAPVWQSMVALAAAVPAVLAAIEAGLPDEFPERTWKAIAGGMRKASGKLLAEAAASNLL